MDIDLDRWHALVEARRNAEHDGPTPLQLQQAQTAAAQAQADLDRYRTRGATGQVNRRSLPADIAADFARSITELEARVVERKREADRIASRSKVCADRRNALWRLIEAIRAWARAQQVILPGDEIERPPVVTIQGAPPNARDFPAGQPLPQRGGTP